LPLPSSVHKRRPLSTCPRTCCPAAPSEPHCLGGLVLLDAADLLGPVLALLELLARPLHLLGKALPAKSGYTGRGMGSGGRWARRLGLGAAGLTSTNQRAAAVATA
jgi:hypothetical protein